MENEKGLLREEMKKEAVLRMEKFGIFAETIRQFREEGKISCSCGGIHYWFDEDQLQIVRDFEEKYQGFVYYGILSQTRNFGLLLTLFYVSKYKEDWHYDHADLEAGQQCVYVHNMDYGFCSEFGSIGYEKLRGGLIRTT